MRTLEEFAIDGGATTGVIRWEPLLERTIMRYTESNTVLQDYCTIVRMPVTTMSMNIPTNKATGLAVTISEGFEVPVVTQEVGSFNVTVVKYGTGAEMTDEAVETDWLGIMGQEAITEAAKRMLRKENVDILAVILASYGDSGSATSTGTFKLEDIVAAKIKLQKSLKTTNTAGFICLVNSDQEGDLQIDGRLTTVSSAGTDETLRRGIIGQISGVRVVAVDEIPTGTAFMMDLNSKPLWFVIRKDATFERYRDVRTQVSGFTMTKWAKPAAVRTDAVYAITGC